MEKCSNWVILFIILKWKWLLAVGWYRKSYFLANLWENIWMNKFINMFWSVHYCRRNSRRERSVVCCFWCESSETKSIARINWIFHLLSMRKYLYCWLKYTAVFVMIDSRPWKRNIEVKFTSRYWTAHIHLLFAVHIQYVQEMKSSHINGISYNN